VPRPRPRGQPRRAQSEVLGGLIILTLIFMFAIPALITLYYANVQASQAAARTIAEAQANLNEKLAIGPVDPNNPIAQRADWIPGVWINNTGTVAVTLDKLYLVDETNKTIFMVYDLRYTRPVNTTYIREMLLNPQEGYSDPLPPTGEPITLQPGDKLLIVFNKTLLPIAPNLIVLVESASGILHPIAGGGGVPTLYPGRPQLLPANGTWRGIFQPQSGFNLTGELLLKRGEAWAWRPKIQVYTCDRNGTPAGVDYSKSFIYDDVKYPGLYRIYLEVEDPSGSNGNATYYLCITKNKNSNKYEIDGKKVEIYGYVGTYDPESGKTYISGYAYKVYIDGEEVSSASKPKILNNNSIDVTDFDGNGVDELTFYSYLNGPEYDELENIDADGDNSIYKDALVWTYMVSRDISGVDFIKITIKSNYYWTTTYWRGCPDWDTRDLRIYALVVWEYQDNGKWKVHQFKEFMFVSTKPLQFQETAVFPVSRDKTYRVGVLFYDNYRDWEGLGYSCYTDFTFTIEHLIVEYGVYNPFFIESPPLYIVAIPDPELIGGIGELDYMNARNIADPDLARILAQQELLEKIKGELSYAGIAGYTIISTPQDFCNLLFSSQPPKYAIIYWLQGNVSVKAIAEKAGCSIDDAALAGNASTYHWVIVWPFSEPFGNIQNIDKYNGDIYIRTEGNYTLNITSAGVEVRKKYYAFYLYNTLLFKYAVEVEVESGAIEDVIIVNATFYSTSGNYTIDDLYGTVAFWLDDGQGSGVVVLNPVHIDWDYTGDGVIPETLAQQIVYSSLTAWVILLGG